MLDDVLCEPCAVPHEASSDGFAVLDPVAYRASLELSALERMVLERSAVPEPQHLTSSA